MTLRRLSWILLPLLLGSCSARISRDGVLPCHRSVLLTVVEFSGSRYVIPVDIDTVAAVPLMIHGNSRMHLSVTHRVGERLTGSPVPKIEEYGYSARGKGAIEVARIRILGEGYSVPGDVPVFDFTDEGETPVQGMLGVPFLLAARAAVDFETDRLLLDVTRQPDPDRRLLESGYRFAPITIQPGGRATVEARFPQIGRTLGVTPSTVSTALTLHLPPFSGAIPMERSQAPDRSPSGTTPYEYRSDEVVFEIAGVQMSSPASFEDLAEYGKVSEDDLESFGMLGFDWMKAHHAVLDYANRRLYFKP